MIQNSYNARATINNNIIFNGNGLVDSHGKLNLLLINQNDNTNVANATFNEPDGSSVSNVAWQSNNEGIVYLSNSPLNLVKVSYNF